MMKLQHKTPPEIAQSPQEIGCFLSFFDLQLFCCPGCFSQNGAFGMELHVMSTDRDYDARRNCTFVM